MAFSDFLAQTGVDTASVGILNFGFIGDLIIFLIVALIVGAIAYLYADRKSYTKSIIQYREVNGQTVRVGTDKAKELILPGTSVRAFYLKGAKFYIPRPSIESGPNEFLFFVRNDGEYLNFGLENINTKLKELGLFFDHTDMRMANASLKKLVDQSYKKINWMKEYAPYLGFGIIILMLGIAGYLIIGESAKVTASASGNVDSLRAITETMNSILSNMNQIASGSGVKPA